MKNPGKPVSSLCFLSYAFLFSLLIFLFSGCDLFSVNTDNDLLKKIDEEIAWANAEKITVAVAYPQEWGISPQIAGCYDAVRTKETPRKGYPFNVEFTPSSGYGFIKWIAFSNDAYADISASIRTISLEQAEKLALDENSVSITNEYLTHTSTYSVTVTVKISDPVTIVPFCDNRPYIVMSDPPLAGSGLIYARTKEVRIHFSMKLDFEDNQEIPFGNDTIQITGQALIASDKWDNPENSFETPVYIYYPEQNFNYISIKAKPGDDEMPPENFLVSVTVAAGENAKIVDAVNKNSMAAPVTITYRTGTEKITMGYKATNVWAVHDPDAIKTEKDAEDLFFYWAGPREVDRRLWKKNTEGKYQVTIYFTVSPSHPEEILLPTPDSVIISEILYADLDGSEIPMIEKASLDIPLGTTNNVGNAPGTADYYFRDMNKSESNFYKAVYTWDDETGAPVQGITRLAVQPYRVDIAPLEADPWETAISEGYYVPVVYDNLAPDVISKDRSVNLGLGGHYEVTGGVYYYAVDSSIIMNPDFRYVEDNGGLGISLESNRASMNKPWTMDDRKNIEWQLRIVTGSTLEYPKSDHLDYPKWYSYGFKEGGTLPSIPALSTLGLGNINTTREIQVRFKDGIGNGSEGGVGWQTIEKFVYYNLPADLNVNNWTASYNSAAGSVTVSWDRPVLDSEPLPVEVSVDGGSSWVNPTTATSHTISGIPAIDTDKVREGTGTQNVAGYTILLRAYNGPARQAEPLTAKIWNIPEMTGLTNANIAFAGDKATLITAIESGKTNIVLTGSFELGSWEPLDLEGRNFYGNGNIVTITGLSVNDRNIGLFAKTAGVNVLIRDLVVEYDDPSVFDVDAKNSSVSIGGIVGYAEENTRIINCIVRTSNENPNAKLAVNAKDGLNEVRLGGIAGFFGGKGIIENCFAGLSVEYSSSGHTGETRVGAIAGETGEGTSDESVIIKNGLSNPIVTGLLVDRVKIKVKIVNAIKKTYSGAIEIGGAVGRSFSNTMRDITFSEGEVLFHRDGAYTNYIGGITGYARLSNFDNCSFLGRIGIFNSTTTKGNINLGGLIGEYRCEVGDTGSFYINNCLVDLLNGTDSGIKIDNESEKYIGGVIGRSIFNDPVTLTITESIFEKGDITITGSAGITRAGGFLGYNSYDTSGDPGFLIFNNSGVLGGVLSIDITKDDINAGGFIGFNTDLDIFYCFSRMDIVVRTAGVIYAGGLIGCQQNGGTIGSCYAAGTVRSVHTGNNTVHSVGGLVGQTDGDIRNSYAIGDVLADETKGGGAGVFLRAGGLVGYTNKGIYNCFSAGQVIAQSEEGNAQAGGIVSINSLNNIHNSVALGTRVFTAGVTNLAGRIFGNIQTGGVENNYAINSGSGADDSMCIWEGARKDNIDFFTDTPEIIKNAFDGLGAVPSDPPDPIGKGTQNGEDLDDNDVRDKNFWRHTILFSSLGVGFDTDLWSTDTIPERRYPILNSMSINHVPGPPLEGQE
ncbi:MAG: hypothetical protein FWG99_02505 [Treponema sp.]|nr:hypothetical protein [Treponema sp.]